MRRFLGACLMRSDAGRMMIGDAVALHGIVGHSIGVRGERFSGWV
jgi:hypothetical protein